MPFLLDALLLNWELVQHNNITVPCWGFFYNMNLSALPGCI